MARYPWGFLLPKWCGSWLCSCATTHWHPQLVCQTHMWCVSSSGQRQVIAGLLSSSSHGFLISASLAFQGDMGEQAHVVVLCDGFWEKSLPKWRKPTVCSSPHRTMTAGECMSAQKSALLRSCSLYRSNITHSRSSYLFSRASTKCDYKLSGWCMLFPLCLGA